MAPSVRRRRWPLFFEPRRRFKKKILKIMKMLRAPLKYSAQISAFIVRGRALAVQLWYLAALEALVKKAGRVLRLEYRALLERVGVRRAGLAARLWGWVGMFVKVWRRERPAPSLYYWAWTSKVEAVKRTRLVPTEWYSAYSPYVGVGVGVRRRPLEFYPTLMGAAVVDRISEVSAYFINHSGPSAGYFIICIDKEWMAPGCDAGSHDWSMYSSVGTNEFVASPPFKFGRVLTAVVTVGPPYAYVVEFRAKDGSVIKRCGYVDVGNPCHLYIEELLRFAGAS